VIFDHLYNADYAPTVDSEFIMAGLASQPDLRRTAHRGQREFDAWLYGK